MFNCPVYAVLRHWSFGHPYTAITLFINRDEAERYAGYLEGHEGKVEGEVITLVEVAA